MTGDSDSGRDELDGLLRSAAQGAAPLQHDPGSARGRAEARRRRAVTGGVLSAAVAAVGVSALVATSAGGTAAPRLPAAPAVAPSATDTLRPTASGGARPSPSAPATARPSPAQPSPAQPGPVQPSAAQPSPAVTSASPPAASPPPVVPSGSTPPSSSPTPPASASPTPTTPAAGRLQLGGDDLVVTRVGTPQQQAVAAVTAQLGPPDAGDEAVSCIGAITEVSWPGFSLAFDAGGLLSGWSSRNPALRTPSGMGVGTTVAQLRDNHGADLRLHPANPDSSPSYTIRGADLVGYLDGLAPASRITGFVNGDCTGP